MVTTLYLSVDPGVLNLGYAISTVKQLVVDGVVVAIAITNLVSANLNTSTNTHDSNYIMSVDDLKANGYPSNLLDGIDKHNLLWGSPVKHSGGDNLLGSPTIQSASSRHRLQNFSETVSSAIFTGRLLPILAELCKPENCAHDDLVQCVFIVEDQLPNTSNEPLQVALEAMFWATMHAYNLTGNLTTLDFERRIVPYQIARVHSFAKFGITWETVIPDHVQLRSRISEILKSNEVIGVVQSDAHTTKSISNANMKRASVAVLVALANAFIQKSDLQWRVQFPTEYAQFIVDAASSDCMKQRLANTLQPMKMKLGRGRTKTLTGVQKDQSDTRLHDMADAIVATLYISKQQTNLSRCWWRDVGGVAKKQKCGVDVL